jgi:hypothetical protein
MFRGRDREWLERGIEGEIERRIDGDVEVQVVRG